MIPSIVLVVHGPNLSLYKNSAGLPILDTEINPYLTSETGLPVEFGIDLEIVQTNDISSVIDILASNPEYYQALVINVDYANNKCEDLAQTIELLGLPTVEINTRKNKESSQLRSITKLELAGKFELKTYELAINYLLSW